MGLHISDIFELRSVVRCRYRENNCTPLIRNISNNCNLRSRPILTAYCVETIVGCAQDPVLNNNKQTLITWFWLTLTFCRLMLRKQKAHSQLFVATFSINSRRKFLAISFAGYNFLKYTIVASTNQNSGQTNLLLFQASTQSFAALPSPFSQKSSTRFKMSTQAPQGNISLTYHNINYRRLLTNVRRRILVDIREKVVNLLGRLAIVRQTTKKRILICVSFVMDFVRNKRCFKGFDADKEQ